MCLKKSISTKIKTIFVAVCKHGSVCYKVGHGSLHGLTHFRRQSQVDIRGTAGWINFCPFFLALKLSFFSDQVYFFTLDGVTGFSSAQTGNYHSF